MWDLVVGDSVRITALVSNFNTETQLVPIANGVEVVDGSRPVTVTRVDVGDLNDNTQENQLETGEQWEGQYIEIVNVRVVEVGESYNTGNGANRQNFIVEDEDGNRIEIGDRFPAGRSVNSTGSDNQNDTQGELAIPPQGAQLDTVRGLILHSSPNGCLPTGNFPDGYQLNPFSSDDIVIGASGPLISNVSRNLIPTSTEATNISAKIVDPDGDVISVFINYAVGLNNTNFLQAAMTASPGTDTYMGQIPETAYSDGDYVRYYLTATDDSSTTTTFPSAGANGAILYRVRDGGASIVDIQFNPLGGSSLLVNSDVTVSGVVTASAQAGDLNLVFIQQPGEDEWAGIQLIGGSIADLERGDSIRVQGTVEENRGFTRLNVISVDDLASGAMVPEPIVVNADSFASYTRYGESYESMLVKFENPDASKGIYVVNDNADSQLSDNFGEWVIGNTTLSDQGSRVLVGRAEGSRSFSYINESTRIDTAQVNVPICFISVPDTMVSLSGIMYYSFSNFKLLPRNNEDVVSYSGANCPDGIVTTGIDAPLEAGLNVYPNPVRETLTIEYAAELTQSLNVQLMDMTGRVVREAVTHPGRDIMTIEVQSIPAGLYLIRIANQQETLMTQKVLVE